MAHQWGKIMTAKKYHRLAMDIDLAITYAALGVYEGLVVRYVIKHSWTLPYTRRNPSGAIPESVPVPLSPTVLARHYDVGRERMSKAIASLVQSHMLIETEAGYILNKNVDEWIKTDGQTRLTRSHKERCIREVKRDATVTVDCDQSVTPSVTVRSRFNTKACPNGHAGRDPKVTCTVSLGSRENRPPQTPLIGTGAELDLIQTEEDKYPIPLVYCSSSNAGEPASAISINGGGGQDWIDAEARATELVKQVAPDYHGCIPWRTWRLSSYRVEWCERAVRIACGDLEAKQIDGRGLLFRINNILGSWHRLRSDEFVPPVRMSVYGGGRPERELTPHQAKQQRMEAAFKRDIEAARAVRAKEAAHA